MRTILLAMVICVVCSAAAMAVEPVDAATSASGEHMRAQVLANVQAVVPDRPFTIGVLLKMEPGWHTYWLNPGDAGLAPTIKLDLPAGFVAGPMQWPLPMSLSGANDPVAAYGYEDSVLLSVPVNAPAKFEQTSVPVTAHVRWLVCKDVCVPGKATLSLTLPVQAHDASAAAPADHAELFEAWARQLPKAKLSADDDLISLATSGVLPEAGRTPEMFTITGQWRQTPALVEWFPGADPALAVSGVQSSVDGNYSRTTFRIAVLAGQKAGATPRSLLVYTDVHGHRHGVYYDLPLRT